MSDSDDLLGKADAFLKRFHPSAAAAQGDVPVLTEIIADPAATPAHPSSGAPAQRGSTGSELLELEQGQASDPRSVSTLPSESVYSLVAATSFPRWRPRRPKLDQEDAARSRAPRTSPLTGLEWPAQATLGSSSASFRIDARACSVSMLNASCGTRAAPLIPV